ncbi:ABC transporter transmembrane domain-containing protein [Novosphingobium sp. MMS21-SN21R]|uniref:ABC transporter transmembrane domain-containing protein n=1 Tax=Novosphingobium sp. MMS21-SN21R TaxID=2969298 RepID=UPI002885495A|nr:ABC transporter transmembrane domain-containing protein [Novosphingobium sp. MMS21-SN21R]MDT0507331.1 ABC transporter transmembrane domain-containing protein [Novosphingobium sp. MMS21-SN21R]
MRRLILRSTAWRMAAPVAVAAAQAGATLIGAALVHRAGQSPVGPIPIGLAVAALGSTFALEVLRRRLCEAIGWREVAQVRARLLRRVLRAERTEVARQRHGAMLQVFVGDLSARRQWWSDGLPRAVTAPVLLFALLAWAAWQSPAMACWIGAVIALGIAGGATLLRPMSCAVREVRRTRGRVSAFASDRIAKAASDGPVMNERAELRRLKRRSDALNRAALHRAWFTGLLRGLPHLVTSLILLIVLLGGGQVSGTIVVIGTAGLALSDLARAAELWIPARISARRIARLMRIPAASSSTVLVDFPLAVRSAENDRP